MKRWRLSGAALVCLACAATGTAHAQQADAPVQTSQGPAKSDEPKTEDAKVGVVIKGKVRRKAADRDVYAVDKTVVDSGGSAADALRRVPGVAVDARGSVTLHGRAVEIYLNGHPSLMLSGDNRSAALQTMPSSYISSIEIMSTPGARFGSQGAGGIINIVTNHDMPEGRFGNVSVNAASAGGYDGSGYLSWHVGKLTAMGSLGYRRDVSQQRMTLESASRATTASAAVSVTNHGGSRSVSTAPNFNGNFEYELGHDDLLRGQGGFMQNRSRSDGRTTTTLSGPDGGLTDAYVTRSLSRFSNQSHSLGIGWTHYGKLADELLKVDMTASRNRGDSAFANSDTYSRSLTQPLGTDVVTGNASRTETLSTILSADYNRPVGDDQLSVGMQIGNDRDVADSSGTSPAGAGADPFDSRFTSRQTLAAAYITWQREFGDRWTALVGLRSETLDLHTDLVSSQSVGHIRYTRLNPSVFATYVVSSETKWRFSYARRLQRPAPRDLNPYVLYEDSLHVMAGNPDLRPQTTDSFEAVYEHAHPGTNYAVRTFFSHNSDLITPSSFWIADPRNPAAQVIETTQRNGGSSDIGGSDVSFGTHFGDKIFLNGNVTAQGVRMHIPDAVARQSAIVVSGSLGVSYMPSLKDSFSLFISRAGGMPTGQGKGAGFASDTLTYSHTIAPRLILNVTGNNLLRMGKMISVTDNGLIRGRSSFSPQAPTIAVGLVRTFGGFDPPKAR